jgi:hypothetical protein
MRVTPRGVARSVDRGAGGPGIEPRNENSPGCRRFLCSGRQLGAARYRERLVGPAWSEALSARSCFPWPPPLAPPTPRPVRRICSRASQLLWRGLTSHRRTSSASAFQPSRRGPALPQTVGHETSRFPRAGSCTAGSETKGREVHRPAAPCRCRTAAVSVWLAAERGIAGC